MDIGLLALVVSIVAAVLAMIAIGARRLPQAAEVKTEPHIEHVGIAPHQAMKAATRKAVGGKKPARAKRK